MTWKTPSIISRTIRCLCTLKQFHMKLYTSVYVLSNLNSPNLFSLSSLASHLTPFLPSPPFAASNPFYECVHSSRQWDFLDQFDLLVTSINILQMKTWELNALQVGIVYGLDIRLAETNRFINEQDCWFWLWVLWV